MSYGKRLEISEVESRLYQYRNVQQVIVRAFTDESADCCIKFEIRKPAAYETGAGKPDVLPKSTSK